MCVDGGVLYGGVGRCVWKLPRNAVGRCFRFLSFFPQELLSELCHLVDSRKLRVSHSQLELQQDRDIFFLIQGGFM